MPFLVVDPQQDEQPLPRDFEEEITMCSVERIPLDTAIDLALSGSMHIPSSLSLMMAERRLRALGKRPCIVNIKNT